MNTTAYDRVLDAFRSQGLIVQEKRDGVADCQAPGHSDRDRSVRVTRTEGQTLVCCFSDPTDQVLDALGLRYSDLFDNPKGVKYEYDDGRIVVRSPDKDFKQYGNKQGNSLYRVNRAVEAIANGRPVILTEGEKDVHAIEAAGGIAACTAMGAGKAKMFDFTPLRGGSITIVADKDEAGEKHAREVAATLLALDCQVSIVNAAEGKDAADHIAAGNTLDTFIPRDDLTAEARLDHILATATAMRDGKSAAAVADQLARNLAKLNEVAAEEGEDGALHKFDKLNDEWWVWLDDTDDHKVIPTPWPQLNDILAGGLHPGRSYIFAAPPGGGKSLTITNIAPHAAALGHAGAIWSVEMGRMEVTSRIMAAGADAHYGQITRRELDDRNMRRLAEYSDNARELPIWICDDANVTIGKIDRGIEQLQATDSCEWAGIDYMQILKADDPRMPREQQVATLSGAIKRMARKRNVATITACQINRNADKENRPPRLSDLRESGAIGQDADVVIALHHETEADGTPTGMVKLITLKNRTGPLTTIELPWRPHHAMLGGGKFE